MIKTKILIVEDEALIADNLAATIEELNYEVTDICSNAEDALKSIKKNAPDICLLDVNIEGEIDGIDLAELIHKKISTQHIFLTSFSDSSTIERAKKTIPSAYIIKPYTSNEVEINLTLAQYRTQDARMNGSEHINMNEDDSFFIKSKHELRKIKYNEISYGEAAEHYTVIFTPSGKHMVGQSITSIFDKLQDHGFIKIHRSYFARLRDIESIGPNYIIIQGNEIPLSQNYRQDLLTKINLI